jgi:hypothetical protein
MTNNPDGSTSMTIDADASGPGGPAAHVDLSLIDCMHKGDNKTSLAFVNNCTQKLWFLGSSIQGGVLEPGQFQCRDIGNTTTTLPAIRYWGYTAPDPGLGKYTLAEFTLNTTFNDFDWYDISHVDAQNLPMQIAPVGMPTCRVLTCAESLLANCPAVGQVKDATGQIIACVSPEPNNPNSPVAQYFDKACRDAYSWSGDDAQSMASCAGEDYDIVFCP